MTLFDSRAPRPHVFINLPGLRFWRDSEGFYVLMTGRKLRLYHSHDEFGEGYYALRIGRRWLYRFRGHWRFSEYGRVIS